MTQCTVIIPFFYFIFLFFLFLFFHHVSYSCVRKARWRHTKLSKENRDLVRVCAFVFVFFSLCVYVCVWSTFVVWDEKDNQPALQTRCITKTKQYFSLFSLAKINQIGHFLILYLCISITSIYLASCAHWFCCWYFSSLCLILKTVSFGNCCCCLF